MREDRYFDELHLGFVHCDRLIEGAVFGEFGFHSRCHCCRLVLLGLDGARERDGEFASGRDDHGCWGWGWDLHGGQGLLIGVNVCFGWGIVFCHCHSGLVSFNDEVFDLGGC